ncbi:MAG: hypothetical protein WB779_03030 [Ignavibacteriaceae bacterium]|jgi:hypothetical protein
MKLLTLLAILLISIINVNAQGIGKIVPIKPPEIFPPNALGGDVVFTEGGFGLGGFYRHSYSTDITLVSTFSVSEFKGDNEFTYINPYTLQTFTYGKLNRIFLIPLTVGLQFRMFSETISDNLRPFVEFGVGPTFVLTTPYDKEFLKAFGSAHNNMAGGGYIGIGANLGTDKSSLVGLNIRYYYARLLSGSVESLIDQPRNDFGEIFISLSIGAMY